MLNETQVVLLGTGTPNACYDRSGPAVAIIVNNKPYIIDAGAGVVRQASKAYKKGIIALHPQNLDTVFITHLHSDHTVGLPDFIFTPWVLERKNPLKIYGPNGINKMVTHLLNAYELDIHERIEGLEKANYTINDVVISKINSGLIYKDENINVEAISVNHGSFDAYAYKFITPDKTIVISGDTAPCETLVKAAKNCDILVHEVYSGSRLLQRASKWQKYHSSVHTSTYELAEIASAVNPKTLVLYHQLFMEDVFTASDELLLEIKDEMIDEIQETYKGKIIFSNDLDIIN